MGALEKAEAEVSRLAKRERLRWVLFLILIALIAAAAIPSYLESGSRAEGLAGRSERILVPIGLAGLLVLFALQGYTRPRALRRTKGSILRLLEEHQAELEETARAKSEFLANMSHEIRTPLTGMMGMTELALDTELTKEQREYLTVAMKSADSLLALVNDVLDFTRIGAGKIRLEQTEFELRTLLEDTGDSVVYRAAEKNIEFACHVYPDVPNWVRGDPGRLRQVLVNLITNGIRFTERGEVVLAVRTERLADKTAIIMFSVSDTGIGIPEHRQKAIFDLFTQGDGSSTRRHEGSGLGLTICRELVHLMGGDIWVESKEGVGSTFHVRLPFELAGVAAAKVKRAAATLHDARLALGGRRVLVVDDNATNRMILERMLKPWGVEVDSASSGSSALATLRKAASSARPFDLVVLDVQMPWMDGFQVERAVRRHGCYGTPKIVFLSSAGEAHGVGEVEISPDSRFLAKPVRQSVFLETLMEIFQQRRAIVRSYGSGGRSNLKRRKFKARVLVVDDDAASRSQILRVLVDCGYDATVAGSGLVALGILRRKSFDVVLMDCDMPAMDGLATTRRIRAQARWAGLPIIGLVTGAAAEKRRRCLEAGMDDSLRKPVYSEELLQAVQRWGTRPENEPEAEGREAASDSDTQKPPERVVLDSERALGMLGGDRELFREVLSTFVSSIPETMEAFQEGIADADMQGLKIRAHSLKGTAACVCAEVVRESAQRIENLLEEGKLEEVRKALEVLRSELDELGETAAAVIAEVQQSSAGGPSQSPAP